jgi:plasmid stabilization system protein ParE
MVYRVELTERGVRDLDLLYQYILEDVSPLGARWFKGLEKAIRSLEHFPAAVPSPWKAEKSGTRFVSFFYGTKLNAYRILFGIDEGEKVVRVITIRHGRMNEFTASE